ncbi:MAG: hypothetical protein U0703_18340 [Anaerolineae bacterium]
MIEAIPIPPLYHVRQTLPSAPPIDVEAAPEFRRRVDKLATLERQGAETWLKMDLAKTEET